MINTLLEAGVDKDCATAEKWSPLHAAAEKGKLEAVRTLQVRCLRGFERGRFLIQVETTRLNGLLGGGSIFFEYSFIIMWRE